jgi:hypothetical protein
VKTETEAAWAGRVEEWRKSGKTAAEFAADKPYASSTLQWAASRLRGKASGRRRETTDAPRGGKREAIRLAKVVRLRQREVAESELLVEVAGARVAVRRGFDVELLRAVVRALEEER